MSSNTTPTLVHGLPFSFQLQWLHYSPIPSTYNKPMSHYPMILALFFTHPSYKIRAPKFAASLQPRFPWQRRQTKPIRGLQTTSRRIANWVSRGGPPAVIILTLCCWGGLRKELRVDEGPDLLPESFLVQCMYFLLELTTTWGFAHKRQRDRICLCTFLFLLSDINELCCNRKKMYSYSETDISPFDLFVCESELVFLYVC